MAPAPMIIPPQAGGHGDGGGQTVRGTSLVIQDWPAEGLASEVAPPPGLSRHGSSSSCPPGSTS